MTIRRMYRRMTRSQAIVRRDMPHAGGAGGWPGADELLDELIRLA